MEGLGAEEEGFGVGIETDIGVAAFAELDGGKAGVIAQVKRCTGKWCRITGEGFDGWIEQQRLWGVYADEKVN